MGKRLNQREKNTEAKVEMATTAQLAELEILIKQSEKLAKTINKPLTNLIYSYGISTTIRSVILPLVPLLKPMLKSFLNKTGEILDEIEKQSSSVVSAAIAITLFAIPFYYAIKLPYDLTEKTILKIFPNGLTRLREKLYNKKKLDDLLSYEEIDSLIQEVKKHNADLKIPAKKVIWLSRLLLASTASLLLLGSNNKIVKVAYDNFGRIAAIDVLQDIRSYIVTKRLASATKNFVSQVTRFNLNSEDIAWEFLDENNPEFARASLAFYYKNQSIKFKFSDKNFSVSAKTYIQELNTIIRKAGWEIISGNEYAMVIKAGPLISEKKVKELLKELQERLYHCYVVTENKHIKLNQINELLLSIGVSDSTHFILKKDNNKLSTFNIAIPHSKIPPELRDDLLHHISQLFGESSISLTDTSIIINGHGIADDKKRQIAISDLKDKYAVFVARQCPAGAVACQAEQITSSTDDSLEFKTVPLKRKNQAQAKIPAGETKTNHSESTQAGLRRILQLNSNTEIYSMRIPWTAGDTHFSVIDPKLEEVLTTKIDYSHFCKMIMNGHVTGNNTGTKSSSTGIVPSDQEYKDVNGIKRLADYKAKSTHNIRIFGYQRQVKVNDKTINVVTFNGVNLSAH